MVESCIFCKISKGEIPKERIYENDNFFSFLDIHPVTDGHCLVVSKKHFENSLALPNSLGSELFDCIKHTTLKIMKDVNAEGFNLHNNNFKVAGQLVPHFHMHIIPRKNDDGFKACA